MSPAPFALIVISLAIFLASTRQFATAWRIQIWLAGLLVLIAASAIALDAPGRLDFLVAAFDHPEVVIQAVQGNWQTIGGAAAPLLGAIILLCAIIAALCLAALTPGEALERAIRPVLIALIGAVAGGLVALALAGVGYGGLNKRSVYVNQIAEADVIDGDTIRMGDIALRLWGIDAPESKQPCEPPYPQKTCGELARDQLAALVRGQLLVCTKPNGANGGLKETFGRPLVVCTRQSDALDVNREMVRSGCADVYRDNGVVKSNYENDLPPDGAPRACPPFEHPGDWRDHRRQRARETKPPNPS